MKYNISMRPSQACLELPRSSDGVSDIPTYYPSTHSGNVLQKTFQHYSSRTRCPAFLYMTVCDRTISTAHTHVTYSLVVSNRSRWPGDLYINLDKNPGCWVSRHHRCRWHVGRMVGFNHPFCSNEAVGAINEAAAIFVLLHYAPIKGELRFP